MDNSKNNESNNASEVRKEESKKLDANADFLYMLTSNRLQNQLQQIDSLDGKNISLLGFSCTLIAILVAAIAIIKIASSEITLSYISLGISVLAFIFIVGMSLKSYFTKPWGVGPDLQEAWEHSKKYTPPKMLQWAADSFIYAYNCNSELTRRKVSSVNKNIWALIIQIFFSALAVILIYLY